MPDIQTSLHQLADSFVQGVLKTLAEASLSELSHLSGGAGAPRGARRGAAAAEPARRGRGRAAKAEAAPAAGASRRRGGRRARRSSDDVGKLAESVVDFIRQAGGNVAVSDIARGLGVGTADVTRPVAIALKEGRVHKTGEKRLTRYFVGAGTAEKKTRAKKK